MTYSSASDVAALCRNILGSASTFDSSTSPTLTQVNAWLSTGCAIIEVGLGNQGYSAITTAAPAAYGLASQAEAMFAAWMTERSRTSARVTADERTRADMLKKDFDALMKDPEYGLLTQDLGRLGVTQTGVSYAGGISKSDKSLNTDGDTVPARFNRGWTDNPLAPHPAATNPDTTNN